MSAQDQPSVRKRAFQTKTKTGCHNCRLRKIKCDEARPACRQCLSTGRACHGFALPVSVYDPQREQTDRLIGQNTPGLPSHVPGSPSYVPGSPSLPLLQVLGGHDKQSLEFYYHRTAGDFGNAFQSSLWQRFALQLLPDIPAILYATLAVASIHRSCIAKKDGSAVLGLDREQRRVALGQYGQALRHLRSYIESAPKENSAETTQTVLLACILLMSFDTMRNDRDSAQVHLTNGLRLARRQLEDHGEVRSIDCRLSPTHLAPSVELGQMMTLLNKLAGDEFNFRIQPVPSCFVPDNHQLPTSFESLRQAQRYMLILASAVSHLRDRLLHAAHAVSANQTNVGDDWIVRTAVTHCLARSNPGVLPPCSARDLSTLQVLLPRWQASFAKTIQRDEAFLIDEDEDLITELRLCYFFTSFILADIRETRGTQCDRHHTEFEAVLNWTERYLNDPLPRDTVEGVMSHVLYLIVLKCRISNLRRRAIQLFHKFSSRQELRPDGLNVRSVAVAAEKVAEMEQTRAWERRSASQALLQSDDERIELVEDARFSDVVVSIHSTGDLRLVCTRPNADGSVEVVDETVHLQS